MCLRRYQNGDSPPFILLAIAAFVSPWTLPGIAAEDPAAFALTLRYRVPVAEKSNLFHTLTESENWPADKTAVVVCDVWDSHHCLNAVRRVQEMAPRMNEFLREARRRGALIIHAPSDCMQAYEGHPARRRAQEAPRADNLPAEIGQWCHQIPAEEQGQYPIDQSDGGEDDDPQEHSEWKRKLAAEGRNPERLGSARSMCCRFATRTRSATAARKSGTSWNSAVSSM